jgi:predicted NUDIX family NTP pyrophosphohydrolase
MPREPQVSAGLLMCRAGPGGPEFLLAHPGGPYFARRDDGAWTLPKGWVEPGEDPLAAAQREFHEETGFSAVGSRFEALGSVVLKSQKRIHGWAFVGDCDPRALRSNRFELEWPPRSGRVRTFPEVDRIAWCNVDTARLKLSPAQHPFIERARVWLEELASGERESEAGA